MAKMAFAHSLMLLCIVASGAASPIEPTDSDVSGEGLPVLDLFDNITNTTQTTPTTLTTNVTDKIEFGDQIHEARSHDGLPPLWNPETDSSSSSSSSSTSSDNVTLFTLNSGNADNSTLYVHSSNEEGALTSGETANVSVVPLMDDDFRSSHQETPFNKMPDVPKDGAGSKSLIDGEERLESEESTRNASNLGIFQSPPVPLPVESEVDAGEEVSSDGKISVEPEPNKDKVAVGMNENENADGSATLPTSTGGNNHQLTPLREAALDAAEDERDVRPSILELHPTTPGGSATGTNSIRFRANVESEWRPYVDSMANFLEAYSKEAQERNVHCDFERSVRPGEEACRFDLVYLGPSCTKQNNFGYGIGKPCVLVSPAPIDGWVPAPYENDTTGVPDEIQRLMRIFNANFMFVMCEGETESDRANIGPMAYLPPYQGFPSYFFPNKLASAFGETAAATPHYVAPLMAIEFLNPANGTLIGVKCKAWAKNLADIPRKTTLRFSFQVN